MSVGKIGDIFAHRSTGAERKAAGNMAMLTAALDSFGSLPDGGLVFSKQSEGRFPEIADLLAKL